MNSRRLYGPSVLGSLAAGGIAFFAASRTWAHATVTADGVPSAPVNVSGADAVGLVPALALVVVTAALAVLAASAGIRRGVGVLIAVVAVVAVVVTVMAGGALDDAVASAVHDSPAFIGTNTPTVISHGPWRWIGVLAFIVAAFVGVVIARFGAQWPTMGRKYDSPAAHTPVDLAETEADIWKALDDGRDPTQ